MLVYNSASFELFYHIGLRQTPREENSEKCRAFLCVNIPGERHLRSMRKALVSSLHT